MTKSYLHCVVVVFSDGGQNMNSFEKESSAIENSKEIIEHIKLKNLKGMKVYLSDLPYDYRKNLLLTSKLVDADSELVFSS